MYILNGALSRPGQNSTVAHPARIQLDTAATQSSWITQDMAERANLTMQPSSSCPAFESRLFPGQRFTPTHWVIAKLRFPAFNFNIESTMYVLPKAKNDKFDVLLGDTDISTYR